MTMALNEVSVDEGAPGFVPRMEAAASPGQGRWCPQRIFEGLASRPSRLDFSLLYDEAGGDLFDQICRQPEYYLPRAEERLLRLAAPVIGQLGSRSRVVVDLGCGEGAKLAPLLEGMGASAYVGIDICEESLRRCQLAIQRAMPALEVTVREEDFMSADVRSLASAGQSLVVVLAGSTVGNLERSHLTRYLRSVALQLGPNDVFLVGVDGVGCVDRTVRAYNDRAGVTARFNLNVLHRLRGEFGFTVAIDDFEHRAFFDRSQSRIELHLECVSDTVIGLGEKETRFRVGETIHTENSYKFRHPEFLALAAAAGLVERQHWEDEETGYHLFCLTRASLLSR